MTREDRPQDDPPIARGLALLLTEFYDAYRELAVRVWELTAEVTG